MLGVSEYRVLSIMSWTPLIIRCISSKDTGSALGQDRTTGFAYKPVYQGTLSTYTYVCQRSPYSVRDGYLWNVSSNYCACIS